ncbi:hypothetical protein ABZ802_23395 [Streptomyces sp. NPDC047737]
MTDRPDTARPERAGRTGEVPPGHPAGRDGCRATACDHPTTDALVEENAR